MVVMFLYNLDVRGIVQLATTAQCFALNDRFLNGATRLTIKWLIAHSVKAPCQIFVVISPFALNSKTTIYFTLAILAQLST